MNFNEIKQLEDTYQLATYKKMNVAVERGEGAWVWTSEGEKYLDLYGGHAVCATGHCHPHVVKAIQAQAGKVLFYSNLVYSELRAKVSQKLVSIAPASLTKAFFCNSGTEAKNAMRMVRMATGRENVISFSGSFHGRTAELSALRFWANIARSESPTFPDIFWQNLATRRACERRRRANRGYNSRTDPVNGRRSRSHTAIFCRSESFVQ